MEKQELIGQILLIEWPMFRTVNRDRHVSCQENKNTFTAMRTAQFSAWSLPALEAYWQDVREAQKAGRNLMREKYIRMMKSTAPEDYARLRDTLPSLSPQVIELTHAIWARLAQQTEAFRARYPALSRTGRPLHAEQERDGWASVETYETSELMTYSEETLHALLEHLLALEAQGISLAWRIQEQSILCLGFSSLEEAEQAAAERFPVQT